jgi:hypothetical protein
MRGSTTNLRALRRECQSPIHVYDQKMCTAVCCAVGILGVGCGFIVGTGLLHFAGIAVAVTGLVVWCVLVISSILRILQTGIWVDQEVVLLVRPMKSVSLSRPQILGYKWIEKHPRREYVYLVSGDGVRTQSSIVRIDGGRWDVFCSLRQITPKLEELFGKYGDSRTSPSESVT